MKTVAKQMAAVPETTQVAMTWFSLWMLCAILIMLK
jgi:hypothetical protein